MGLQIFISAIRKEYAKKIFWAANAVSRDEVETEEQNRGTSAEKTTIAYMLPNKIEM